MIERRTWSERPLITACVGALAALAIQQLINTQTAGGAWVAPAAGRVSLSTGIGVAAILAMFTLERLRWTWSVAFAAAWGIVAALVTWWNGPLSPSGEFMNWRVACLFLSVAVAAPLFQTARDAGGRRFDYAEVHGHVWTNVVLLGAAGAFTGITFALAHLLAELFGLIGIHVLRDLLGYGWANALLFGAAFGGATGLFRERDAVVRTIQRVVTAVLAVLAPVLGAGLLLFLAALPFTGLGALWDATKATTPILLACVIGALVLVNAVLGDGEEEARGRVLHWGAIALGIAALPLAVIAAIATGLRIDQYGFTPDRLWALTFVIVACTYGVAYLVTLARWRRDWATHLRPANLRLAFALMALALLLATPIVSFNAISTRDQVARLQSGRVAPEKFDWTALAFDLGDPGRAALGRLAKAADARIARLARTALANPDRWQLREFANQAERRERVARSMRVLPRAAPLPTGLADLLPGWELCGASDDRGCVVLYRPGASEAVVVAGGCVATPGSARHVTVCQARRLALVDGAWRLVPEAQSAPIDEASIDQVRQAARGGAVEVRPIQRRQVFIGGRPVGVPFE